MMSQCYLTGFIVILTLSDALTSSLIINGQQPTSKDPSSSPSSSSSGKLILASTALHTEITLNSGPLANRINRGPHSSELYLNHFPHRTSLNPSSLQATAKSLDSSSSHIIINQSDINRLLVNLTHTSRPLLVDKRFAESVINKTTTVPPNNEAITVTTTVSTITTPSPLTHKKGLLPASSSSVDLPITNGNIMDKSDSMLSRQVSPLIYLSRDPTSPDKYEARGDTVQNDETNSESGSYNGTNSTNDSQETKNDLPPRRGQLREADSNGGSSDEAGPPNNYSDSYNKNRYYNMQPFVGNSYGMSPPRIHANSFYKYGPPTNTPKYPMSYSSLSSSSSSDMYPTSTYTDRPVLSPSGYNSHSQSSGFPTGPNSSPIPYPLRPINSSEIDAMVAQLRNQLRPKAYPVTNHFANAGLGHNRYQPLTNDYYASSSSARGSLRPTYSLGPSNEGWSSTKSSSVASSSPASSSSSSPSSSSASSSASSPFIPSQTPLTSQSSESGSSESSDDENGSGGSGNSGQDDSDQPYHPNNYQAHSSTHENNKDDVESYSQANNPTVTGPPATGLSSSQFSNDFANNMLNYGKLPGEPGGGFGMTADFTVTNGPDPSSIGFNGGSEHSVSGLSPDNFPNTFSNSFASFPLDAVQSLDPLMGPSGFKSPHEYIHNYYDTEPKEKFRYVGRPGGQEYYNNDYQQSSRPSPYAPQNSMKDFMRVVDSVKHVVYKMKPLKTVASKMYRDFTDKMKKRIKGLRVTTNGPPNSVPSPHHNPHHNPHHHPLHHHHQHSVPLPHPGLGPTHLGPAGPLMGPIAIQGMGGPGAGQPFQHGGFNPMTITAMSELAGIKIPPPPGVGGSPSQGLGGSGLKGGLSDLLGGGLGGGGGNGDISSLINQYLGGKDGESNNNNMDDNLMDELNQALISQLVGGLKLRREDEKNTEKTGKKIGRDFRQKGGPLDEDGDSEEVDDEVEKEMKKYEIDRRSAPLGPFNDKGAPNNPLYVSSIGFKPTKIDQLINSTEPDSSNNNSSTSKLFDKLTMESNHSPVRLIKSNTTSFQVSDALLSYKRQTSQIETESNKFGELIKTQTVDKINDTDKSNIFVLNSTLIEASPSVDKLSLVNSTKQGNKETKATHSRSRRSSQLFIQHGNSDGKSTLITDDKHVTTFSKGQIVTMMPNDKGTIGKDLPGLSPSFAQKLTDDQRSMISQLLTATVGKFDDDSATFFKYSDPSSLPLTIFDQQHINLSDPLIGLTESAETPLLPYYVLNNDLSPLGELINDDMSKIAPSVPTLIDYMLPDGDDDSNDIFKAKLSDLTNSLSFSPSNTPISSSFSGSMPPTTTSKPDIYLKIIEVSPEEPLVIRPSFANSTPPKPTKEPFRMSTITKINEKIHFPTTVAKGDIKNLWRRFPSANIWPIGSGIRSRPNIVTSKSSTNHQTTINNHGFRLKLPRAPLTLPALSPSLVETMKKARLFFHYPSSPPSLIPPRSPPSSSSQPSKISLLSSSPPLSSASLSSLGTSKLMKQQSNQLLSSIPRPPIILVVLNPKLDSTSTISTALEQKLDEMVTKSNSRQSSLNDLTTRYKTNLGPKEVKPFNQINKGLLSSSTDVPIPRLLSPINRKSTDIESSLKMFPNLPPLVSNPSSAFSNSVSQRSTQSVHDNLDLSSVGKMILYPVPFKSIEQSSSSSSQPPSSQSPPPSIKLQSTSEPPEKMTKFLTDSLWSPSLRAKDNKASSPKYSQPLESKSSFISNLNPKDYQSNNNHNNNHQEWIPTS